MKKFIFCFLMLTASVFILVSETKAETRGDTLVRTNYSITTDYNRIDDFHGNCVDFAHTLRIGGYLIFLVKILLPLILIVKTSMNLMVVVTSGDQGELKKQVKKVCTSLLAAILIFFIPTIIDVTFGFIEGFNANKTADARICKSCIFDPFSNLCRYYAE